MIKTSIQLTKELHEYLQEESKKTGESMSSIIRETLRPRMEDYMIKHHGVVIGEKYKTLADAYDAGEKWIIIPKQGIRKAKNEK